MLLRGPGNTVKPERPPHGFASLLLCNSQSLLSECMVHVLVQHNCSLSVFLFRLYANQLISAVHIHPAVVQRDYCSSYLTGGDPLQGSLLNSWWFKGQWQHCGVCAHVLIHARLLNTCVFIECLWSASFITIQIGNDPFDPNNSFKAL